MNIELEPHEITLLMEALYTFQPATAGTSRLVSALREKLDLYQAMEPYTCAWKPRRVSLPEEEDMLIGGMRFSDPPVFRDPEPQAFEPGQRVRVNNPNWPTVHGKEGQVVGTYDATIYTVRLQPYGSELTSDGEFLEAI